MSDPVQDLFNGADFGSLRRVGPVDHEDRQAESAGGIDLGAGAFAAGIPGYQKIDPVRFQKVTLFRLRKRPPINDDIVMWQRWALLRDVDESQEIVMLRRGLESRNSRSPDGKENPPGRTAKRPGGFGHARHSGPAITRAGRPRRPGKRDHRHASGCTGRDSIPAHLRGERVGCIDQVRNGMVLEVGGQARCAAKSAGSGWQGLCDGIRNATGIGKRGAQAHAVDVRRKGARLGGAAQDQEIWRHV